MTWKRARSDEQKEIRLNQIIEATIALYETVPYDQITLAGIAKKLDFTRANLYKYVSSKEDIFIKIIERDGKRWVEELIERFEEKSNISFEEFAILWAETMMNHQRLIGLYSILYSVIEKGVRPEKLAPFKMSFIHEFKIVYSIIALQLPSLTYEDIDVFLNMQLFFAMGLYPATIEHENQKEAMEILDIEYRPPDFIQMFSRFVLFAIKGLASESENAIP
ncbi:MAG: TetR family transcriptional regulator [Peptostreptococcales bacterium]